MGFCFAHYETIELVPLADKPKPAPNKYTCRLCEIIIEKVEEKLNNKTAQQDIENCVKQICVALPSSLRSECKKLIDAYADEIIKHFPSGSPTQLCKKACVCDVDVEEMPKQIDDIGMLSAAGIFVVVDRVQNNSINLSDMVL